MGFMEKDSINSIFEKILIKEDLYYSTFFECSLPILIIEYDSLGLVDINRAAQAFFVFTPDKVNKTTVFDLLPDCAQELAYELEEFKKTHSRLFTFKHLTAQAAEKDVEALTYSFIINGKAYIAMIIQDITVKKSIEHHLSKINEVERILSNVSHHFITLNPDELINSIQDTLCIIGNLLKVETCFILFLKDEHKLQDEKYIWKQDNTNPDLMELNSTDIKELPWAFNHLSRFLPIKIDNIDELPSEAFREKAFFSHFGVKSTLIIPVKRKSNSLALMGVFRKEEALPWNSEDVFIMGIVSSVLINALDRKIVIRQLRESEEKYRNLVEDMPNLICRFSPDLILTYVNNAYCEYFHQTAEELIGSSLLDHIPVDEQQKLKFYFRNFSVKNPISYTIHKTIKNHSTIAWQRWSDRAFFNDAGEITEFQSIGDDITEQKELEIQLRDNQQKLSESIRNQILLSKVSSFLIQKKDLDSSLKQMPALLAESIQIDQICLWQFPDYYQRDLTNCCSFCGSVEQRFDEIVQQINKGIRVISGNANSTGDLYYVDQLVDHAFIMFPLRLMGKIVGFINFAKLEEHVWTDIEIHFITSVFNLMQINFEKEHHLKESSKYETIAANSSHMATLGQISASISHEINQPLNAINLTVSGMLFWLEEKPEYVMENLKTQLNSVSSQVNRINNTIQNLRTLIRKEPHTFTEKVNLNYGIERALELIGTQIMNHRIDLIKDFQSDIGLFLGSTSSIEQVVINLLVNAIQALDEVEIKERIITIRTREVNFLICLEIENNGPSIKEDYLDNLFNPLFTTKASTKNMGLGLSICKTIVQAMNGKIEVQNLKPEGVKFSIYFNILE